MKKILFIIITILLLSNCKNTNNDDLHAQNQVIDSTKVIEPLSFHPQINKMITRLFLRYHYKKINLNDSLSSVIFDNYIKMLDYNKLYFLQSDINEFEKDRYKFDDYLILGKLMPAYRIFNTYKKRMNERIKYILKRLKKGFDFTKDEYYIYDREKEPWAKTEKELNEIWRRKLKNEALSLKLSGKKWDKIVETLTKRYENYHRAILQYKPEEVFELYMNAFADAIDPHSNYLRPTTSETFDIRMKLSLEGIGATLRTENDYTKVVSIVPGGPAYKADNIHADDKIIGVGQGKDGEIVDVIGWRIDDVVHLIRGPKGTIVRLAIIKGDKTIDSAPDTISILRDKVKLEEQAAKKEIINIKENGKEYKIGVIDIPTFYVDFEARRKGDPDYKSTTRDVRKLIKELKEENVDGLIIDLRNDGGGSLDEAISLTGLFIKEGPVVQVRRSNGEVNVEKDPDPNIVYDGPLAVMVNRYSASASEIFSAAIQDYGRGIIVGEQTYGKGTVQNLIPLDRFVPSAGDKSGQLKLTIAKFYRINGGTTQSLGVVPDIALPSPVNPSEYGESAEPSALKWDKIKSAEYQKYGDFKNILPILKKKHLERIKNEKEFIYLQEDIEEYKRTKDKKKISLNEEKRKAERAKTEAKKKAREKEREKYTTKEKIDGKEVVKKDLKIKDPFLEETGHILADLIQYLNKN